MRGKKHSKRIKRSELKSVQLSMNIKLKRRIIRKKWMNSTRKSKVSRMNSKGKWPMVNWVRPKNQLKKKRRSMKISCLTSRVFRIIFKVTSKDLMESKKRLTQVTKNSRLTKLKLRPKSNKLRFQTLRYKTSCLWVSSRTRLMPISLRRGPCLKSR